MFLTWPRKSGGSAVAMGEVVNAVSIFADHGRSWKYCGGGVEFRKPNSISQCFPRLQCVLDSFLSFLLTAERLEGFSLQVEQVLLTYRSAGSDISATNNLGDLVAQFVLVVGNELALPHQVDPHLERSQDVFPGRRDVRSHDRRLIASAHQFEGAGFGVRQHTITVHRNAVGIGQKSKAASFVR